MQKAANEPCATVPYLLMLEERLPIDDIERAELSGLELKRMSEGGPICWVRQTKRGEQIDLT